VQQFFLKSLRFFTSENGMGKMAHSFTRLRHGHRPVNLKYIPRLHTLSFNTFLRKILSLDTLFTGFTLNGS